jgi:molecular chaperone DnaJ
VDVTVAPDERFERRGEHLVTVARISATRAMLGGEVTVPSLEGEQAVEVPAGAQPGERVVLDGLGLPRLRGRGRGDQHVVLDVVVPGALGDEQRELAERLEATLSAEQLEPRPGAQGRWRRRRRARRA